MFNCKTMRTAVLISLGLLVSGLLFEFVAVKTLIANPFNYLAIVAVLGAVVILAAIFVLALIPATARRLDGCQH